MEWMMRTWKWLTWTKLGSGGDIFSWVKMVDQKSTTSTGPPMLTKTLSRNSLLRLKLLSNRRRRKRKLWKRRLKRVARPAGLARWTSLCLTWRSCNNKRTRFWCWTLKCRTSYHLDSGSKETAWSFSRSAFSTGGHSFGWFWTFFLSRSSLAAWY